MNTDATTIALNDGPRGITYAAMHEAAQTLAHVLRAQGTRVLATLMDNSPAWVIADLAAGQAGVVHVPLPAFFTPAQIGHALMAAGVDSLLTTEAVANQWAHAPRQDCTVAGQALQCLRLPALQQTFPAGTAKITFTSGTTGQPKGVCLTAQGMRQVADGLVQALEPLGIRRHLCALPFAVLLENIAGVMAPLARGAEIIVLPLGDLGLTGSSSFDPARFHAAVELHQPNSLILLPQMLRAWVGWLARQGQRAPASLRMVAVGGAAVGAPLIEAAHRLGIPAYEGYGLSEGASVQTLNLPGADRPGSAGKPLPHASVRVTRDGELEVSGSLFAGYLGDPKAPPDWWPTGDLGHIDADGFVQVRGRRKNVLITAFGRNVSPEWVETALRGENAIGQAVVLGDGQAALSAVLWPTNPAIADSELHAAVHVANASLPDYARIRHWVRAAAAFSADTGMATANGRPQRDAILARHAEALGLLADAAL